MRNSHRIVTALLFAVAANPDVSAATADAAELQALREQVRALEQQLKTIMARLEMKEEAAAPASGPPAAKSGITDKGYQFSSDDAANSLRLRGLLHVDSRVFLRDAGGNVNNSFVLRRARLGSEGRLARLASFQFVTEFGGSTVSILDANFAVGFSEALQFKFGKFKTPIGHEVLQPDAATMFVERSMVAGLLPNRDLGVQVGGSVANARLNYSVGVFNGIADGANSTNFDFDEDKDLVARIMAAPFKGEPESPWRGLSFGVGGSDGRQKSAAGRTSGYRTDGQQIFFAYNPAVVADGRTWRVSPQLDYRWGPLGLMAEHAITAQNLRPTAGGRKIEVRHRGWHVTTSYVLTGEDSNYGQLAPRADFNPQAGLWGAFEVAARYDTVRIDDAAFPLLASVATNAREATGYTLGLNWFLSKAVVFRFNYSRTEFSPPAGAPAVSGSPVLRQDENAFFTRFQLAF